MGVLTSEINANSTNFSATCWGWQHSKRNIMGASHKRISMSWRHYEKPRSTNWISSFASSKLNYSYLLNILVCRQVLGICYIFIYISKHPVPHWGQEIFLDRTLLKSSQLLKSKFVVTSRRLCTVFWYYLCLLHFHEIFYSRDKNISALITDADLTQLWQTAWRGDGWCKPTINQLLPVCRVPSLCCRPIQYYITNIF